MKRTNIVKRPSVLVVVILALMAPHALAQQLWVERAPMSTARAGQAAAVLNGIVHVLGGSDATDCSALQTHQAYDPIADAWTERAPMSEGRTLFGAAVLNDGAKDLLYVIGGTTGCGTRTDRVESYDPDTDTWTTRAPMRHGARSALGVAVIDNRLYVAGGVTSDDPDGAGITDLVEVYDPRGDQWLPDPPPMPHARRSMAIGAIDGILYVAGGGSRGIPDFRFVDAFDPTTNQWSARAPLSVQRAYPATAVANGRLYAIGGEPSFLSSAELYDPALDTWIAAPNLPHPIARGSAATVGATVYVSGGFDGAAGTVLSSTLAVLDPGTPPAGQIFLRVPDSVQTQINTLIWGCGFFLDMTGGPGAYKLRVDYGDGYGEGNLPWDSPSASNPWNTCLPFSGPPTPTGVFALAHRYTLPSPPGGYQVRVTITDTQLRVSTTRRFPVVVTAIDVTPPVFVRMPADFTVEATSGAGAIVGYMPPTAIDAVDGSVPVSCTPPPGRLLALGPHVITCTASDRVGNTATATFAATVIDTTPPTIHAASASISSLWPPNHQMVPIAMSVAASDLVDPAPVCSVVRVTSSEPVDGLGDGDMAPDWTIDGGLGVSLRAERAGKGSGRVYVIQVRCVDRAGNVSAPATVNVDVRHNR